MFGALLISAPLNWIVCIRDMQVTFVTQCWRWASMSHAHKSVRLHSTTFASTKKSRFKQYYGFLAFSVVWSFFWLSVFYLFGPLDLVYGTSFIHIFMYHAYEYKNLHLQLWGVLFCFVYLSWWEVIFSDHHLWSVFLIICIILYYLNNTELV